MVGLSGQFDVHRLDEILSTSTRTRFDFVPIRRNTGFDSAIIAAQVAIVAAMFQP